MTARINYIPTANWRFFIHQQADFETKMSLTFLTIWIIIYEFFAVLYGEIREYCNSFDIRFGAKVGDVDMRLILTLFALLFTQLFFNWRTLRHRRVLPPSSVKAMLMKRGPMTAEKSGQSRQSQSDGPEKTKTAKTKSEKSAKRSSAPNPRPKRRKPPRLKSPRRKGL